MAKQIKVIQCPQCGGNKPVMIDKDHYRCSKCDTDFILDSDDINVNVNHNYGQNYGQHGYGKYGTQKRSSSSSTITYVIIFVVVVLFILSFGISLISRQFVKTNNRTATSTAASAKSDIVFSVLLNEIGRASCRERV